MQRLEAHFAAAAHPQVQWRSSFIKRYRPMAAASVALSRRRRTCAFAPDRPLHVPLSPTRAGPKYDFSLQLKKFLLFYLFIYFFDAVEFSLWLLI